MWGSCVKVQYAETQLVIEAHKCYERFNGVTVLHTISGIDMNERKESCQ